MASLRNISDEQLLKEIQRRQQAEAPRRSRSRSRSRSRKPRSRSRRSRSRSQVRDALAEVAERYTKEYEAERYSFDGLRRQARINRVKSRSHSRPHVKSEYDPEFEVMKSVKMKQRSIFNGKAVNYTYKLNPYPVTESTVGYLSKQLSELAGEQLDMVLAKHPKGANIYMKMLLSGDGAVMASAVVKLTNVKKDRLEDEIFREMSRRSNKHYPTKNYIVDLTEVMILVSGYGTRGGCDSDTHNTRREVGKNCTIHLTSHKSSGNNCLLQCFNHAYGVSGRELKAAKVRKALKLGEDDMIEVDDAIKILDYYNKKFPKQRKGVVVINQDLKIMKFKHPIIEKAEDYEVESKDEPDEMVQIYLMQEHYYTYRVVCFRKCEECGEKLLSTNDEHECSKDRVSYYNTKISKKRDMVRSNKIQEPKIDYEDIVHWDLETFQPAEDGVRHEIYASGFYDRKYKVYYGQDAGKKTIDHFLTLENRTISAYNGSGFDFTFLLDKLTERGANIENMVMNNGRIMSFTYHVKDPKKSNKIFDLYLFTMTGLGAACSDFKIENAKTEFDHSKMKAWSDVDKYKEEVLPYLKMDVLGLKELFEKFNDVIFEIEKTNITRFLTCSHMGYSIWQNMLDKIVEIPKDLEKMDYIAKAVYGGRCYPHQQQYKSEFYDAVKAGTMKYKDVVESESKDFIFNADASSLYPASMSGFDHMKVKYPIGRSRWSEKPEKEYKNKKMGFYEILFTPPSTLRIPVLPRRQLHNGQNVGVSWSLEAGHGVYTSIDIKNALEANYKIRFIGKALVYDESGDVFTKYIEKFYKLKGQAEKDGNDSMRNIAKLMLNSLYGKMLMAPIDQHTEIINNAVELEAFLYKYDLVDYSIVNDNKIIMIGGVKGDRRVDKINKPRQLGAFVTAYSRRIMLFYMKEIDPTLKSMIFTYTDTDSLHISGMAYLDLMKKGLIKTKKDAQLGYLCSDIKNEGVILKEINLAPKTYMYESIDNEDAIKTTMKCKGIPKKALKEIDYNTHGRVIEFFGMKRKTTKLTKSDVEKGIPLFSVCNNTQSRTFMKNVWTKMKFQTNQFFPAGYEGNEYVEEINADIVNDSDDELDL